MSPSPPPIRSAAVRAKPDRSRPDRSRPALGRARQWSVWLGVLWLTLPFTTGSVMGDAWSDRSVSVRFVATVLAWAVWGVGLIAVLVPHPISLTALRVVTPAAVAASVWAVVAAKTPTQPEWPGVACAVAASAVSFLQEIGLRCVNGPAYPNERRFLLRPPAVLLAGPMVIAWAGLAAGVVTGPLLLAARAWVAGAIVTVIGLGAAALFARALHGLSKRFVVFVPAGLVVHDLMALREAVLFPKAKIAGLAPAYDDTEALDLTLGAAGLTVEVNLTEPADLTPAPRARITGVSGKGPIHVRSFLFTPTLPGRLLAEARDRKIV